jgi:hypothetical protein
MFPSLVYTFGAIVVIVCDFAGMESIPASASVLFALIGVLFVFFVGHSE